MPNSHNLLLNVRCRSNLARLLQFQFLCAASNYQQDCAAAYKLLVYVCLMTEGNEGPTDFNYQASTLLMRLCTLYPTLHLHIIIIDIHSRTLEPACPLRTASEPRLQPRIARLPSSCGFNI